MIIITTKKFREADFEFIERKGLGHPDTLADALAEHLSVNYSNYTFKKFGAILHHNFDKVSLLGGSSSVSFGRGYLVNPIRVLLNGRASVKFGNEKIPVKELLINWAREFFKERLPMINPIKDLEFHCNLSSNSSPGRKGLNIQSKDKKNLRKNGQYWFKPRNLDDIPELEHLVANDTSLGVGYAPKTLLEELILEIEGVLNSKRFKEKNLWIGSDIKIMGFRLNNDICLTICVPQLANFVKSIEDYKKNIFAIRKIIMDVKNRYFVNVFKLDLNTRDNYQSGNIYLTAIGTSIESGDEGVVGRGNRINGVISPTKPMSMEGSCGKNPVYYAGKLYYIAAEEIAQKIYKKFNFENEVFVVSQVGRDLIDPWIVLIVLPTNTKISERKIIENFVSEELSKIPKLTSRILEREFSLY